jgi:serine/threonine protein kinase
MRHYDRKYKHD